MTLIIVQLKITMRIYSTTKKQISSIELIWRYCERNPFCLNTNKVSGVDQIPEKFLEEAADALAYPLKFIAKTIYIYGRM